MTKLYQYQYKEGQFNDWFSYTIVDGCVLIHPADVLDYIRYKVTIMGDVFSYEECLECLNDIMKEIAAFGPHQKNGFFDEAKLRERYIANQSWKAE